MIPVFGLSERHQVTHNEGRFRWELPPVALRALSVVSYKASYNFNQCSPQHLNGFACAH